MSVGGFELGEVVAQRELEAISDDGSSKLVHISIGRPAEDPNPGGDWYCSYSIVGLGDDQLSHAYGADSLQALMLCLQKLKVDVQFSARRERVRLTWAGGEDIGLL
jgi:hypothetical protein